MGVGVFPVPYGIWVPSLDRWLCTWVLSGSHGPFIALGCHLSTPLVGRRGPEDHRLLLGHVSVGGDDGDRGFWLLVAPADGDSSLAWKTDSKSPSWAGTMVTHASNICLVCDYLL